MSQRPLSRNEIDYLERTKASLDGALQALLVTVGLLAMPFVFLAFTFTGRGGWSGDRVSTAIAGFILLGLVAAVVYYTALGRQETRFDREAYRHWRGLGVDLAAKTAEERLLAVTAKQQVALKRPGSDGSRKAHYVTLGDRRFRVSAGCWLAVAEGDELLVAFAPQSGLLLEVDGEPERLRLPRRSDAESAGQLIG